MTTRTTRLIRARNLTAGTIVIAKCTGSVSGACSMPAREHDAIGADTGRTHELTILDAEIAPSGLVSAIIIGDDGEQGEYSWDQYIPLRIVAAVQPEVQQ